MQILVADDESKVRSALKFILHQVPNVVIIDEAEDFRQLVAMVRQDKPDLVLLDWELPGLTVQEPIIEILRSICADIKIIILSGDIHARKDALEAGANSFICKSDPPEKLLESIHVCLTL